jgi:hypothetical protein
MPICAGNSCNKWFQFFRGAGGEVCTKCLFIEDAQDERELGIAKVSSSVHYSASLVLTILPVSRPVWTLRGRVPNPT